MLALWEYFWDNNPTWGANRSTETSGSKSKQYYRPKPDSGIEDYRGAPKDYWDVRERYLRRFMEPVLRAEAARLAIRQSASIRAHQAAQAATEQAVSEGQSHLGMLTQARDAVVLRARQAATETELRQHVQRVIKLTLDISALRVQYYERAAMILLLDLF